MLNLAMLLDDTATTMPDRPAVVLGGQRLTYGDVAQAACRVANLLVSRGVGPGDKVALSCPNLPAFAEVYYGILKVGATVVPLNVLLKAPEIAYHLRDSQAKAYFCFAGTADMPMAVEGRRAVEQVPECRDFFVITAQADDDSPLAGCLTVAQAVGDQPASFQSVATDPSDTAVILYTSGTTGQPKGAELSHANMVLNALTCNRLFESSPAVGETPLAPWRCSGLALHTKRGSSQRSWAEWARFRPDSRRGGPCRTCRRLRCTKTAAGCNACPRAASSSTTIPAASCVSSIRKINHFWCRKNSGSSTRLRLIWEGGLSASRSTRRCARSSSTWPRAPTW